MKIGILTIGNELTSGRTQDTNSSLLARSFHTQGWQVAAIMSIGDDEEAIGEALDFMLAKADALVVTGGLGPTADDITTAAIARFFSLELEKNEEVLAEIKRTFEKYRIKWSENNAKQAFFPAGAEVIPNPVGTACGFALEREKKLVIVIPGVPREVERVLPTGVIPRLQRQVEGPPVFVESQTIKLFGLAEALVDQALSDVDFDGLQVAVGFYPNFPENHVVITARGTVREEILARLRRAEGEITKRLKDHIFAIGQETLEERVASILTQRGLSLAVAESCTGGLISDRLTNIPGSSAFFERGVVVYSNEAKVDLLGVPPEIIGKFGAVSRETAGLMAAGVRRLAKTDLGLATTGIAGPTGGTEEKPVGTVFVALADGHETLHRNFSFRWDRRRNKIIASQAALMLLKDYLHKDGTYGER